SIELSLGMRDQGRAQPSRSQPHHRVHHLALTTPPGTRRVYVEREHTCLACDNSRELRLRAATSMRASARPRQSLSVVDKSDKRRRATPNSEGVMRNLVSPLLSRLQLQAIVR